MLRDLIIVFTTILWISFVLPVLDAFSVYIQNIINGKSHELQLDQELKQEYAKHQIEEMSCINRQEKQVGFRAPVELETGEGEETYGKKN